MPTENAIEQLLEDGLGAYGQGDLDKAIEAWRSVLDMEPANALAIDYLKSAGIEVPNIDNVITLAEHRPAPALSLAEKLKSLLKGHKYSDALSTLLEAKRTSPQDAAIGRAIQRVKDKYVVVLVRDLGKLDQRVCLTTARDVIEEIVLDDATREIVDLIDDETSLGDLVQASMLEKHTALESLSRLHSRGLINLQNANFSLPITVAGERAQDVAQTLYAKKTSSNDDFDTQFRAATMAYVQGDLEESLYLFEKCEELRPGNTRVQHNLERLRRTV